MVKNTNCKSACSKVLWKFAGDLKFSSLYTLFSEHLWGQVLLNEDKKVTSGCKQLTSGSNVTDCWKAFTAPVRLFVFMHAQPKENPTPG